MSQWKKFKKGIWQERRRVDEGSKVEKVGIRRENNGGICTRVQKSSKRK